MKNIIATFAFLTLASASYSHAKCEITVTRTPCPGKKIAQEALGPYGMKEVEEVKKVENKSEADCKAETTVQGTIKRKGLFLKKVAVGKFDGKVIETKEDSTDASTCKPEPK